MSVERIDRQQVREALAAIEPFIHAAALPWTAVWEAARAYVNFPTDEDVRNDAVADWCEVYLAHYDWDSALAVVRALFEAVADAEQRGSVPGSERTTCK